MATKKYTRTTISVPQELKDRMDAAGDETINWSALACRAFEQKLTEITSKRGAKDMNDVISRLRASKQKTGDQFAMQAREIGRDWAMNRAEAVELERLAACKEDNRSEWDDCFEDSISDAYGVYGWLAGVIEPLAASDRGGIDSFWEQAVGEDAKWLTLDGMRLRAFAEAAIEVWYEVEDKL